MAKKPKPESPAKPQTPPVPASLKKLMSQAGGHRRGLKVLAYGPGKTGKSYFLASFPGPICAIACGEGGIEPFLDPSKGDKCFVVHDPNEFHEAKQFALDNADYFGSLVIDNVNLLWEDWMHFWEDELDVEEIKGSQWRKVKAPWKKELRDLMRTKLHIGMSAWLKDILYTEEKGEGPGVRGKISIVQQDNPQVEKTVPYTVDLIFRTAVELDDKYKPTPFHQIIFYGGRRPRSVPPEELHTGKVWRFDSRKPVPNVWDAVIKPFYDKWTIGAVDHLGVDPQQAGQELKGLEDVGNDAEVGRLLRVINSQTDLKHYQLQVWPTDIEPALLGLPAEQRKMVLEAHTKKKEELQ